MTPLHRALRPFERPQYRVLIAALTASLLGAGIWSVAMVWQVMALGGGPTQLSAVAAAGSVGLLAAVLLGGAVADRVPQRRILLAVELTKALTVGAGGALALAGLLQVGHLVVIALVIGLADAFFYPAYTALLPSVLPPDQLLAANGLEGVLRPLLQQALGPGIAGVVIGIASPEVGLLVVAGSQLLAAFGLTRLRTTPVRRESGLAGNPVAGVVRDVRDGFAYMVRTRWILATLLFACVMLLLIMGPIQVLLPFAIRENVGGGAAQFAMAIAGFGIGGAVGSMTVASLRLPRRYLTVMIGMWGFSCLPLIVAGTSPHLWLIVACVAVCGAMGGAANVIWGTLLQRRVPPEMLGRVSSLDFFVSLALMPVSMAIAGPVGEAIGRTNVFLVAALAPPVLSVLAIVLARLPADEMAHPIDAVVSEEAPGGGEEDAYGERAAVARAVAAGDEHAGDPTPAGTEREAMP
jgi:MFS family permease